MAPRQQPVPWLDREQSYRRLGMDFERWNRIKDIVNTCRELKPQERKEYVLVASGGEPDLIAEVESLLSDEKTGEFSEHPLLDTEALREPERENLTGRRIGNYQLLELIAHGGMGAVYKATRADDQFRKQVAIKLIRSGFDFSFVRRFRAERQILANLDQPNIARLLDGGTTSDGRPYLVMELIDGQPIDVYCDSRRLPTDERLRLFRQVCAAVQFAHQNLVIHRDLKPSNILVTPDGVPKLLDFGIAKILDPAETGAGESPTATLVQLLTPEYASPEQFRGGPFATATDVYSLGVVLYSLLTGRWPYRTATYSQQEIAKAICEMEPEKPSTAIARTEKLASGAVIVPEMVSERRGERLDRLQSRLKGDLDNILLKALRKEPERRYASVDQFSEDIRRYLAGLPVMARKDTVRYRAGKFVSRHKAGVFATAGMLALLIAAVFVSSSMAVRASRAEREARAVNDFLQNDLLAQASASAQSGSRAKPDPNLKVRTALDRAAASITGKFGGQPDVEASIRDTIGQTYLDLGLYPEARIQLQRARDLYRRTVGNENAKTLRVAGHLGYAAYLQGNYSEAESLLQKTLEIQRRVLGIENPDTLHSMNQLATVYGAQGKNTQAAELHSQTVDIQRRVFGPEHPDTLNSMNGLAIDYEALGKYPQAESLYKETLEIRRRVLGVEHPNTLSSMNNLANIYGDQSKYAQAEPLYSETLEIRRRVLGSEHPETVTSMLNLATDYHYEGKYAQAEALHNQALGVSRRLFGPAHPYTLTCMNNLAAVYAAEGRYAQAEPLFKQTVQTSRRALGPEHPLTLSFLAETAYMYQREGNYAVAEVYAAQALAGRRHVLGSEHPETMPSASDLALAELSQGKYVQSEALAREAFEFDRKKLPDDWQRFRAESLLGASLCGQKKYAEAEPLLLEGYQGMLKRKNRIDVPDWYHVDRAGEWLVELYRGWGRPKEAADWRARVAAVAGAPASH
jgi:eukaryotic-like serine/threonine-protein kinase